MQRGISQMPKLGTCCGWARLLRWKRAWPSITNPCAYTTAVSQSPVAGFVRDECLGGRSWHNSITQVASDSKQINKKCQPYQPLCDLQSSSSVSSKLGLSGFIDMYPSCVLRVPVCVRVCSCVTFSIMLEAAYRRRHFGFWKTYHVFEVLRTWITSLKSCSCKAQHLFFLLPALLEG